MAAEFGPAFLRDPKVLVVASDGRWSPRDGQSARDGSKVALGFVARDAVARQQGRLVLLVRADIVDFAVQTWRVHPRGGIRGRWQRSTGNSSPAAAAQGSHEFELLRQ